jgi:hypothetical protein
MIINSDTHKAEDKLLTSQRPLFQRQKQQQQQYDEQQRHANGSFVIKELINAGAITSKTEIEIAYPIERHNYCYCKYCDEKGQVIRFQRFETFRMAHINSFFYWRKVIIKTWWRVFDGQYGDQHQHVHTKNKNKSSRNQNNQNKKQSTDGVAT